MKQRTYSPKQLRQRKLLLVLPLLVLPFLTLGFWALGGGKGDQPYSRDLSDKKGLNLSVPAAQLSIDKGLDKLAYYEKANEDSNKLKARMKDDPYFELKTTVGGDSTGGSEATVYNKLQQINEAIEKAQATSNTHSRETARVNSPGSNYTDRVETVRQAMQAPPAGNDTELQAINNMLEKVMDIQHPERLTERYQQANQQKEPITAVTTIQGDHDGFFNGRQTGDIPHDSNTLEAVVAEDQILVNNARIKLRLRNSVTIGGRVMVPGQLIYGRVSLAGERLTIIVSSIRAGQTIMPVHLAVYDLDGMDGIHIPGALTREVAKQSTDNALQSLALNSLDPSIGTQAAAAGIETAKTFISKKVKLVRVAVKAGYQVLLVNDKLK